MLTMSTLMMPATAVPTSMSAPGLLPVPKLEAIRINHTPPNTMTTTLIPTPAPKSGMHHYLNKLKKNNLYKSRETSASCSATFFHRPLQFSALKVNNRKFD